MSFSRRKFLRSASLLSISALVPMKTLIAKTTRGQISSNLLGTVDSEATAHLNYEAFDRCLNTDFVFARPYKTNATVKLIEVRHLTGPANGSGTGTRTEAFAAVFVGNTRLPQETYAVEHSTLGTFDMFVVPVGNSRKGLYYEAIFNRVR